jgi:hypothetical protein
MRDHISFMLVVAALGLAGCATVTQGTQQAIAVASTPDGAQCTFMRSGKKLGTVTTPGSLTVSRDGEPINVLCTKEGYDDERAILNAKTNSATYGNALLGGSIGIMVDRQSHADSRYDPLVAVSLSPLSPADQAARASGRAPSAAPPISQAADVTPPRDVRIPVSASQGPFDGEYEGSADVLQTDVNPPVPHTRHFEVRVVDSVGTGIVKHPLCDKPGEVFLLVDPSGDVRGEANMQNTTGCTKWLAKFAGRIDGNGMLLTLRVIESPVLVLGRIGGPPSGGVTPVAMVAASRGPFAGDYTGGIELASGDIRRIWIRITGDKGVGTARYDRCPRPGGLSLAIDSSGTITGEADLVTASCETNNATLAGRVVGERLKLTATLQDDTQSREFTFARRHSGAGVDD